jgi:hypothetical protein
VRTAEDPAAQTEPAPARLDRAVLVGNLVSGAVWLWPLAVPWALNSLPLFVLGTVYVLVCSVFLAAVYARPVLSRNQEVLAWVTPWLVAVALWAVLLVGTDFENTVWHYLTAISVAMFIATPCYLVWQISALAVRQLLAWRSGRSFLPSDETSRADAR